MVLLSGNDKSVPAHLVAIARCNLPAIHVPGGTQLNAPDYVTSNKLWPLGTRGRARRAAPRGARRAAEERLPDVRRLPVHGQASTGQVLAEALGLALPGSALIPAPLTTPAPLCARGRQADPEADRARTSRPRDILTREAFENAIMLHAAVGGSTNALLHLPAIAREVGIDITIDDFDRIHRRVPGAGEREDHRKLPRRVLLVRGRRPGGDARAPRPAAPGLPHRDRQDAGRESGRRRAARLLRRDASATSTTYKDPPRRRSSGRAPTRSAPRAASRSCAATSRPRAP